MFAIHKIWDMKFVDRIDKTVRLTDDLAREKVLISCDVRSQTAW